jgi:tetratricopeptide (TPR) repeat protein
MALLEDTQQREDAETIVDIAVNIENLLMSINRRQILQQVAAIRQKAEKGLKVWNNTSFNAAKNQIERLLEKGSLGPAQTAAQDLLKKSLDAFEDAYPESAYNIAMANRLLGYVLKKSGASEPALLYLESARTQFDWLGQDGNKSAQRMASVCLTDQGDCLRDLGRLDEAAAAYEERIALAEKLGDLRGAAVGKGQLGTARYSQKQYAEALTANESAIQSFESLGEPASVAIIWHQMGMVHESSKNYPAAETAYRKSLGIRVQHNVKNDEAASLLQLGNLFQKMGQLEDAVTFYRQAADIHVELGDLAKEGIDRNNLSNTFIKLKRYDDARQEIVRAIECDKPFGHTAEPWKTLDILCDLEQAQGNATEAKDARDQAVALYMDFRRSGGGKYEDGAQLCEMVKVALKSGDQSEVKAAFQNLAEPDQPFVKLLKQVLNGVKDVLLIEELNYNNEVDIRLLVEESLGGKVINQSDNFLFGFKKAFIKKIKMGLHTNELIQDLELLINFSKKNRMHDSIINDINKYILISKEISRKDHFGILLFYKSLLNCERKAFYDVIANSQDSLRHLENEKSFNNIKSKIYENLIYSYSEIGEYSKGEEYLNILKHINNNNESIPRLEGKLKKLQRNQNIITSFSI